MSISLEHPIAAPLLAVEAALLDRRRPALVVAASPVVRHIEVLSWQARDDTVERRILVSAEGLRALLGGTFVLDTIQWIDHLVWDRRLHCGSFRLDAQLTESLRRQLHCHGEHRLIADTEQNTRRLISCHLRVDLPGIEDATLEAIKQVVSLHFAEDAKQLTTLARRRAHLGRA
ncbi:MAG TPA: hypothetical protein VGG33_03660 [Polyangia bacterium]